MRRSMKGCGTMARSKERVCRSSQKGICTEVSSPRGSSKDTVSLCGRTEMSMKDSSSMVSKRGRGPGGTVAAHTTTANGQEVEPRDTVSTYGKMVTTTPL